MHPSVYFACATVAGYLAYRSLSQSSTSRPKVVDGRIAHATKAPNPLITNDLSALASGRVETEAQRRVTAALLRGPS